MSTKVMLHKALRVVPMVVSRLSQNVKISIVELFCHIRNVPFEKIGDLQMTLDYLKVSTSNARTHV